MVAFQSGVGRLVWGRPGVFTAVTDDDGKPVLDEAGQPVTDNSFGVAFPKQEFINILWPRMLEAASVDFPGGAVPQDYAWKYVDGDLATGHKKGKPYNEREGYPGCFVMAFTTRLPNVTYFKPSMTAAGAWDQIAHTDIKTGDYVAVSGQFVSHKAKNARSKPGLYTNPQGVLLIGVGQAIINTPDAQQMFGGMNYQLPPGATMPGAAPAMPGGMATPPGMPGQMPQPMPGQQYQPQPMPGAAPVPTYAPPAPQPSYYPQQPMPGAPPVPQYAPAHDIYQPGVAPNPTMPGQQPGYAPTPGAPVYPTTAPVPQYPQPGGPSVPTTYPSNMPGQMPPGFPPQR